MQEETFGQRIARLRKEKQMTQVELSSIMHVTDKAVSKWERDVAYPDISALPKLASALGVSIEELMTAKAKEITHRGFDHVLGIILAGLTVMVSAFLILFSRANHEMWLLDCVGFLSIGATVWTFQKREWSESIFDRCFKILILLMGISLIIWSRLGDQSELFDIAGLAIALLGARLLYVNGKKVE